MQEPFAGSLIEDATTISENSNLQNIILQDPTSQLLTGQSCSSLMHGNLVPNDITSTPSSNSLLYEQTSDLDWISPLPDFEILGNMLGQSNSLSNLHPSGVEVLDETVHQMLQVQTNSNFQLRRLYCSHGNRNADATRRLQIYLATCILNTSFLERSLHVPPVCQCQRSECQRSGEQNRNARTREPSGMQVVPVTHAKRKALRLVRSKKVTFVLILTTVLLVRRRRSLQTMPRQCAKMGFGILRAAISAAI